MNRRNWLAGVCSAGLLCFLGGRVAAQNERVVKVHARRFVYTPSVINVKKGEPVVLELTTEDVLMGLSVPDLDIRTDIVPGKTTLLRLTPQQAGTYEFLCDIFCGSGHESMHGKIIVA